MSALFRFVDESTVEDVEAAVNSAGGGGFGREEVVEMLKKLSAKEKIFFHEESGSVIQT